MPDKQYRKREKRWQEKLQDFVTKKPKENLIMNIMLTKSCNLKCPYCFANQEMEHTGDITMNLETFQEAKEFALKTADQIGLIGGEPTSSPYFEEILKDIIKDPRIKTCSIFTNGTLLDRYIKYFKNPKFWFLININPSDDMGDHLHKKMLENIELLHNTLRNDNRIFFGYNLYNPETGHGEILNLLSKYKKKRLRISITCPTGKVSTSPLEAFKTMKPSLFKLFKGLKELDVIPHYDCNILPSCLLNHEERLMLFEFDHRAQELGFAERLLPNGKSAVHCRPVLDITPDLHVVRCFALSDLKRVSLRDFENPKAIEDHFLKTIDIYKYSLKDDSHCTYCSENLEYKCSGGCLGYFKEHLEKLI
jgi:MoaA/NifB/PqqE/SkfB family radical SAM enzyme